MSREQGPYTAARRLCLTLRTARERVGRTQAEVATMLGWSTSKLARIENGDVGIGSPDLQRLCGVYELGPSIVEELSRLAQVARRRGWWHEFRDVFPEPGVTLMAMEAEAAQIRLWSPYLVPGLLQTVAYAEALLLGLDSNFRGPEAASRGRLTARLRRQDVVFHRAEPPDLRVVLDESVLYRAAGGADTMAQQVRWLAECARRPNVRLRIRPFESSAAPVGEFALLNFDDSDETAVYGEDMTSQFHRTDETSSRSLDRVFSTLWGTSLNAARTGQLLHRVAVGYEQGRQARPWLLE
jgi:transcriptional regulator with XRE-family HTH domain